MKSSSLIALLRKASLTKTSELNHVLDVLACSRACILVVVKCFCVWCAWRAQILSMLACFISSRAHIFYMPVVLKYLTYLLAFVFWVLVFSLCFTFEKLNSKNYFIEKSLFCSKKYLESTWTSMKECLLPKKIKG